MASAVPVDNETRSQESEADTPPPVPWSVFGRLPFLRGFVREVVEIAPRWRSLVGEEGLADFEGVWRARAVEAFTGHADRHVVSVKVGRGEPRRRFFLKRVGRARLKHLVEAARELKAPVSRCRREWRFARVLEEAGVASIPLVAFGERRIGFWPLESFLIMEEIAGSKPLDEVLESFASMGEDEAAREKRRLAESLAAVVAAMHESGVFHRDLYAKHIFVRRDGGSFVINIIDLQRTIRSRRRAMAVKDLAALNVTLPRRLVGAGLRARFLREYLRCSGGGEADVKDLVRRVFARSMRISKRSKFAGVDWSGLGP